MSPSSPSSLFRRARAAHLLVALALALPAGLHAQASKQPHTFSEKTGEAFSKIKPLAEAKDWDGMLAVLNAAAAAADPSSYDMGLILDMQAKAYGQKGDQFFDKAIAAWEQWLRLNDANHYFDDKATLDNLLFLAQFSYQYGVNSKVAAVQQQYIKKSADFFKRYMAVTPKPSAEIEMFYANILYNQAVADPKKVDPVLLKQARDEIENGLRSSVHPKETFYVLLLAVLQQENNVVRAAEVLEQLVKQYPAKKDYWPSLWASYLNMANDATVSGKDESKARENYVRAINTMERAQANNLMKTPKENLTLVNLYLTVGQYGKATDLLYAGLKNGAIDSDPKNWGLLAYYYQQDNLELKAIAALKEASTLFPANGAFYVQIGQIYLGMEKTKEAFSALKEAVRRGGLEKGKEASAYQALAYAAFELEEFEEALKAVEAAGTYPEGKRDSQLPQLRKAIEDAIKEREYAKAEAAAAAAKKM